MPEKKILLLPEIGIWVKNVAIGFGLLIASGYFFEGRLDVVNVIISLVLALVISTFITRMRVVGIRKEEAEEAEEHARQEAERKAAAAAAAQRAKEIKELNEKYGEPFGTSVYNHKVVKGMSVDAVEESWGKPNLIKNDSWYYPAKRRKILSQITFKNNKVLNIEEKDQLVELNMSKKEVIAIWGEPEDEKETVYKTKTKLRLYYFPRTTRQHTTVYGYEVRLEDDIVVGWKEFD